MAVPDIRVVDPTQNNLMMSVGHPKRQDTYSGVTDANGVMTVTFNPPFQVPPNIQARVLTTSKNQKISSIMITETTATITLVEAVTATVLSVEVLTLGTKPSVGIGIDILVTSK